jgi:acyl-CoA thioesterase-2
VWFHQRFRTDQWLLLRQHSPVLAHGRCFGRGDVLAQDGTLVASYAQEALVRFRDHSQTVGA